MKKIIEAIFEKAMRLLLLYTIGIFLECVFCALQMVRTVRVLNKERIPHNHKGLLVISNHPSLLEPILIPLLFFWDYILHPFKLCPINIPDKANYLSKWYWWWLRFFSIPIDRSDRRKGMEALHKMKNVLEAGGIIFPFTEGGRTSSCNKHAYSVSGNKIRVMDEESKTTEGARGISWLISQTNPTVLFIWVDGSDKVLPNSLDRKKLYHTFPKFNQRMTIKVGQPMCFRKGLENGTVEKELTNHLLSLADEENQ